MQPVILSTSYLGPVSYYSALLKAEKAVIEQMEHYVKGSYRNRCYIASPDGALRLSIPLKKGKNQHTIIKDVRISYDSDWQRIHWQSLCSCYRSSPYFEFYEAELELFYLKKYDFLLDFNIQLQDFILKKMKADLSISYTETYEKELSGYSDLRNKFLPGEMENKEDLPVYHQVFEEETGFLPNMSIVDMLFNSGPETYRKLKNE